MSQHRPASARSVRDSCRGQSQAREAMLPFNAGYTPLIGSHLAHVVKRSDWRAMFSDLESCKRKARFFWTNLMGETVLPRGPPALGDIGQSPMPALDEPYELRLRRIQDVITLVDFVDANAVVEQRKVLEPMLKKVERLIEHEKYRQVPERTLQDLEKQIHTNVRQSTPADRGNFIGRHALRFFCLSVLLVVLAWRCKISPA
ncbi:MAG: hypothetical protein Q9186_007347 [Xanthomendoza sp. 1 TL-2023]